MPSFSERQGYNRPPEIQFREELPYYFRAPLLALILRRIDSRTLRDLVEAIVNPYGLNPLSRWGDDSLPKDDLSVLTSRFANSDWFRLYDIVEAVEHHLSQNDLHGLEKGGGPKAPRLAQEVNGFFNEAGIGWQLVQGHIVTRGDEAFERTLATATAALNDNDKPTAANRLRFAVAALSARPDADTSGAVSHATSAVECVLHDLTGDSLTLGEYLKRHGERIPHRALREGVEKLYGYACDVARHGKEEPSPTRDDAELVLATCAAVCTFLTRKHPQ